MIPGELPSGALTAQARAWMADDPSPADRAELAELLDAAEQPGAAGQPGATEQPPTAGPPGAAEQPPAARPPGAAGQAALAELADRFAGRLEFGTAGLRGAMGAGPNRMNRAVVRAATMGLARWLHERRPAAAQAGVVIGWDARHRSAEFAAEAAAVLTGAGIPVHLLPDRSPTPLLAFAVRYLSCGAGVMITASHNPPADNGYKLYLGDGAQIVPPVDAQIEAAIRELGPLSGAALGPPDGPLITRHGSEIAEAYLTALLARGDDPPLRLPGGLPPEPPAPDRHSAPSGGKPPRLGAGLSLVAPPGADLQVVYTPLHGVAGELMTRAIERAGYPAPHVVAAQAQPDPGFPTVSFPNPEEPGALDLALAEAARLGADLVLASDPDGDRLAVAVPDPAAGGGWRALTGDQVGSLLGAYLLDVTADGPDAQRRLVASTVVSSVMLASIAAAVGVKYVETLTGFKWIVRAADDQPGRRFVFGYEEALGYAVGDVVRDKDGIGAALALLSLASRARAAGQGLLDRWDALEAAHGVHLRAQLTVPTRAPGEIMAGLRAAPPSELAGQPVLDMADLAGGGPLPPSDVLIFRLLGSRVVVRPSGTEPKLKCYLEVVEPVTDDGLPAARARAAARLAPLRASISGLLD